MPEIRIVSYKRDLSRPPAIHAVDDALSWLTAAGELATGTQLQLLARAAPDQSPLNAALLFRSAKGDDALFALPISRRCQVRSTLGDRFYLPLADLDGADVDCEGNVTLRDGRHVHAVKFGVLPVHFELPELEEKIVCLTIRYRKAEARCLRNDYGYVGIDYATLPQLHVRNVEALTNYINARLNTMTRASGAPAFKKVSVSAVERVLRLVGIQHGARAKKRQTAQSATAPP